MSLRGCCGATEYREVTVVLLSDETLGRTLTNYAALLMNLTSVVAKQVAMRVTPLIQLLAKLMFGKTSSPNLRFIETNRAHQL